MTRENLIVLLSELLTSLLLTGAILILIQKRRTGYKVIQTSLVPSLPNLFQSIRRLTFFGEESTLKKTTLILSSKKENISFHFEEITFFCLLLYKFQRSKNISILKCARHAYVSVEVSHFFNFFFQSRLCHLLASESIVAGGIIVFRDSSFFQCNSSGRTLGTYKSFRCRASSSKKKKTEYFGSRGVVSPIQRNECQKVKSQHCLLVATKFSYSGRHKPYNANQKQNSQASISCFLES